MIIRGYAFKRDGELVRVFNTNDGMSSMVMDDNGTTIETDMDEIEQVIVKNTWDKDSKYMMMLLFPSF